MHISLSCLPEQILLQVFLEVVPIPPNKGWPQSGALVPLVALVALVALIAFLALVSFVALVVLLALVALVAIALVAHVATWCCLALVAKPMAAV